MPVKNHDPETIVLSDECRFVLGSNKRCRHIQQGQWNKTCFSAEGKFPESLMISRAIRYNFKIGPLFGSNGAGASKYCGLIQSEMTKTMDSRYGIYKWTFMQDGRVPTPRRLELCLRFPCLVLPGWSQNSPDLNPIQMISSMVKARVRSEQSDSLAALKRVIQ
jgi:hypothetical protein